MKASLLGFLFFVLIFASNVFGDDHLKRGIDQWSRGERSQAVRSFSDAIQEKGDNGNAYWLRANVRIELGQYRDALLDLSAALRIDQSNAEYLNTAAWLLATSPDEEFRRGDLAVQLAVKACQASEFQNHAHVDTLAAALAEQRDFDRAVKVQRIALDRCSKRERADFESRLALYQSGKPYRLDSTGTADRADETLPAADLQGPTTRLCPICLGSGRKSCLTCAGDGWVHNFNDLAFPDDPSVTGRSTCYACGGRKDVICNCGGSGRITVKRN